ncbi:MAG: glycine--tRNA ligase subunit beta [Granulosicoccus sp.]|nr:glycine--tRNA ligase subunit beta [Granulosicoccus sp.]
MADLLFELGCEELPAGSMQVLADHLGQGIATCLRENELSNESPVVFATPRRLAVLIKEVQQQQSDVLVERRGPSSDVAFKDGEPTKALKGFLASAKADIEQLESISTSKGEWVMVRQTQPGKTLAEVLADSLPALFKTMPMPRRMRWGSGTDEFLRPVVWLLAMHGSRTLALELFGMSADNKTYGHRFHAPEAIQLTEPAEYENSLKNAYVLVDAQLRREKIVDMVKLKADEFGGKPVLDDALVDEVNALVEWPVALLGHFDKEFLEIPKEALIQTMQENQRYFALLDENEALLPAFITIANIESTDPQTVIDGNERVIRPRFADTMFFWNQDKKRTLVSHHSELSRLQLPGKLGSVADKLDRMTKLTDYLSEEFGVDASQSQRAVMLCKCDLNTEIVKELAKMQGICGKYYALRDGESAAVAQAMEQHYFPKQAGGALPENALSQIVALVDRVDLLVGIFGQGMKPTGAKDPYGLRRASIAIVRIIIEKERDIDLHTVIAKSADTYSDRIPNIDTAAIEQYVNERLRGYLIETGYSADAVDAVLAKSLTRPIDVAARVKAIEAFRKTDEAASLAAASKRISNLLKKIDTPIQGDVDVSRFSEKAEESLFKQLSDLQDPIATDMQARDYGQAMQRMANLREPIDRFFDDVMVMDEDEQLRNNRLALLRQVNELSCSAAELALLRLDVPTDPAVSST